MPIVWTLHDMNPLTGGCHFDNGCGKHRTNCFECPQLQNSGPRDASARVFKNRERALSSLTNDDLVLVTPSKWLSAEAASNRLLNRFRRHVIPYGLDNKLFQPIPTQVARQALGLSEQTPTLAFVSDKIDNHRKGLDLLLSALPQINQCSKGLQLISAGRGSCPTLSSDLRHVHIGMVTNERLMRLVYSAADVFVAPSRQDNLPNTVLESLACGTPVVGFPVGGIPDVVEDGSTGWLADKVDAVSLANTISRALQVLGDAEVRLQISNTCVRRIAKQHSLELQATQYQDLYQSISPRLDSF